MDKLNVTPEAVALVENFGATWLDGSTTAKTVLLTRIAEFEASARRAERAKNVAVVIMLAAFEKESGNKEAADALDAAAEALRTQPHA